MITFSETVSQIIADGKGEVFIFMSLKNADGSLFRASTTYHSDFTDSNGITYESDGLIVSADPPQQSSTVDREQYKLVLADVEFKLPAVAENGLVGKTLEVRLGFINPLNGLPLVEDPNDTLVIYKGKVDGLSGNANLEEIGELLFTLTGAAPLISLDMSRGIFLSKDFVRARNPADGSCDDIYTGSGPLMLKWGKQ